MAIKSLYEFNQLHLNDKADYLWVNGSFIISVKNSEGIFNLYSLNDFYVEVEMSSERVLELRAFKRGHLMEKYLHKIHIH